MVVIIYPDVGTVFFPAQRSAHPPAICRPRNTRPANWWTIEGTIDPGQELYITIAQKKLFAPKDTTGIHEVKRLKKDAEKAKFNNDTAIPPLYYVVTTKPDAFGKEGKKRFGGPSVLLGKGQGIYSTTMFYLNKKFDEIAPDAKAMLGPHQIRGSMEFSPVCQRIQLRDQHHRQRRQQRG